MISRKPFAAILMITVAVAGCVSHPKLTAEELAKLKGGRTEVVAYYACAPINYITGGKIMTHTRVIRVDGMEVGKIDYCGHMRFSVESGQRDLAIAKPESMIIPKGVARPEIFRPGVTQYLSIYQDEYGVIFHSWSTKEKAEEAIAAIQQVKPVF